MQERQVSVRNGQFDITLQEAGDGEPLLYLHNMSVPEWYPFMDLLAEKYHVLAPMHPGFGTSTGIEFIDEPIDMTIYYNDFLDAVGLDSVNVVGHELGGMFAAELAAVSPDRLKKLVLCTPYGLWVEEHPVPDRYATPFRMLRELQWHDPSIEAAGSYGARPKDPSQIEEFTIQSTRALASGSRFLWQFPDRGLYKRIHRVKAPTRILWGDSDGMNPPYYAKVFEGLIKGSEVVTIENAGNLPMLEQPEAFADAVSGFLG